MYSISVYIPKYNLYTVTCMYTFSADCLALDSQWVCACLGKTTSPTPSSRSGLFYV